MNYEGLKPKTPNQVGNDLPSTLIFDSLLATNILLKPSPKCFRAISSLNSTKLDPSWSRIQVNQFAMSWVPILWRGLQICASFQRMSTTVLTNEYWYWPVINLASNTFGCWETSTWTSILLGVLLLEYYFWYLTFKNLKIFEFFL